MDVSRRSAWRTEGPGHQGLQAVTSFLGLHGEEPEASPRIETHLLGSRSRRTDVPAKRVPWRKNPFQAPAKESEAATVHALSRWFPSFSVLLLPAPTPPGLPGGWHWVWGRGGTDRGLEKLTGPCTPGPAVGAAKGCGVEVNILSTSPLLGLDSAMTATLSWSVT